MKHHHWRVLKIDTVSKTKQKKTRFVTVYIFSFLIFLAFFWWCSRSSHCPVLLGKLSHSPSPKSGSLPRRQIFTELGLVTKALQPKLKGHQTLPTLCAKKNDKCLEFLGVMCEVCVCVWIMCDVCCWCVSWSCYGEFCGYLLVMCVECLVMFVPTSAVLHFVWIVGEIFVVYTSITKVRIGRVFWLKGGSEWHSGSARFCANTSRCRKTRQGRDRCTLDTAVNASFETEMDLDYKKLSVGCIGWSKSSVESVQMVHNWFTPIWCHHIASYQYQLDHGELQRCSMCSFQASQS